MDHNSLTGSLPSCMNYMTFIREVHFTCNLLSGTIPDEINGLTYINQLKVNCNTNIGCYSILSKRSNFILTCGDVSCSNCPTYTPNICTGPPKIEIPGCGTYYPQI